MTRRPLPFSLATLLLAAAGTLACSSSSDDETSDIPGGGDGFLSANPGVSSGDRGGANAGGDGLSGAPEADDKGDGAARAIEEADVIKLEGGKLYALSQFGGLAVIDVGTRDQLTLLGRHKIIAMPFEMYVKDGIVFALYNGYGQYVRDEGTEEYRYVQTSSVVALDARDPSAITPIHTYTIPGSISDSRIVGNVLYVAAHEDGYCWGCTQGTPQTTVISLNVADPAQVTKVDQLAFTDKTGGYSWRRSLTVTDKRMYIAGPRFDDQYNPVGSLIEVVDISDPSGDLVKGTTVGVAGQISSRWQMDEHEGVLRVITQPGQWRTTEPPAVETFRVVSSSDVQPLGAIELVLPRPESLRSVRFDGDRGYAVTFEQTDPLFTIDLSDPAQPKQVGELEIPGFLYHMEPRGDRLVALGFDQSNSAGGLTVSLFDVSKLATPTMLSRVNFGGPWAWAQEDQDRIHKSFRVLDDAGLILVPFSGWEYDDTNPEEMCYGGRYHSGVQLIDYSADALVKRGVAPSVAAARRGFLHDERLFTFSDERVETFDITNRDAPAPTAKLPLARYVTQIVPAGDEVVRIGQNWWTNVTELSSSPLAQADDPAAGVSLDVSELGKSTCNQSSWLGSAHFAEDNLYLVYNKYRWNGSTSEATSQVVTVDYSDRNAPKVAADAAFGFQPSFGYGYVHGLVDSGSGLVANGKTLAIADQAAEYVNDRYQVTRSLLRVVDLTDPNSPAVVDAPLPAGLGSTGLIKSGSIVANSHFEASTVGSTVVRFYLNRTDISDPANPVSLPRVNIPGSLLAYDHESQRAVTVDYRYETEKDVKSTACYERFGYSAQWQPNDQEDARMNADALGRCTGVLQTLKLVNIGGDSASVVGSLALAERERVGTVAIGEDRLFVSLNEGYYYGWAVADCLDCGGFYGYGASAMPLQLVAISGLKSGNFGSGRMSLPNHEGYAYSPLVASGSRVALAGGSPAKLKVVDAENLSDLKVVSEKESGGYVQQMTLVGKTAVASLGYDGVATIDLY